MIAHYLTLQLKELLNLYFKLIDFRPFIFWFVHIALANFKVTMESLQCLNLALADLKVRDVDPVAIHFATTLLH
jgi:hypothetical protein